MPRGKRLAAILAIALVVTVPAAGWLLRPHRVVDLSPANVDRIRKGMSDAEVTAILGGPPGDYTVEPAQELPIPIDSLGSFPRAWETDEAWLIVDFDYGGRVHRKSLTRYTLRERVRRQWDRWFPPSLVDPVTARVVP
jgi:hypothetical protein